MTNEPKALKEVHKIREKIYEETKNMTPEERAKYAKNEAKKIIEKYHLKSNISVEFSKQVYTNLIFTLFFKQNNLSSQKDSLQSTLLPY
ncbi:MAG: hypothetical protein LBG58_01320 [Planctomycetaceae bacterium]|jgi:hypothetical protein|nr:hypothetical protein [Planctomycetaceae bacterium]